MISKIFAIYDSKAKAYFPPFFLHAAAVAKRTFADCVNGQDHTFSKNPADYTLFEIGEFNDQNAQITIKTLTSLGNGVEFLQVIEKLEDAENAK